MRTTFGIIFALVNIAFVVFIGYALIVADQAFLEGVMNSLLERFSPDGPIPTE